MSETHFLSLARETVAPRRGSNPASLSHQGHPAEGSTTAWRSASCKVVVISSSLLVDRVLLYTNFLRRLVKGGASVDVWASSADNPAYRRLWEAQPARARGLPEVRSFRELVHNYPRRVNEAMWDHRQLQPSRLSMRRHRPATRHPARAWLIDKIARAVALLAVEGPVEKLLEGWLLSYERSSEATRLFRDIRPDVVLTTGPYQFEQPAIAASALRLGVPTLALIPSWDNISTKKRMIFKYDGYVVWTEKLRAELHEYYPHTRDLPVYVIGAPQFDVFFNPRFQQSRAEFCATQRLDPARPIIVYAVGSPNFLAGEAYGALTMARAVERGDLGDVQLLVRPHPLHDHTTLRELFTDCGKDIHLQQTSVEGTPVSARSQDVGQIVEWVNTFRHADVVVNLSSTVSVDAAVCDRPVVNLDFDPSPTQADQELVKEINHEWTHFSPIAESGGVWLVNDFDQMLNAVRGYLANPQLHREGRRWICDYVCGHLDGQCGDRLARAVLDFASIRNSGAWSRDS